MMAIITCPHCQRSIKNNGEETGFLTTIDDPEWAQMARAMAARDCEATWQFARNYAKRMKRK